LEKSKSKIKKNVPAEDTKIELSTELFEKAIYEMTNEEVLKFVNNVFPKDNRTEKIFQRIMKTIKKEKKYTATSPKETFRLLEKLDDIVIEYGIARMKKIEEGSDIKSIPYILTIIFFMLPYYKATLEVFGRHTLEEEALKGIEAVIIPVGAIKEVEVGIENIITSSVESTTTVVMFLLSLFILYLITFFISKLNTRTQRAVYFRSLLESSRAMKKDTKEIKQQQIKLVKKRQERIEQKQEQIEQRLFLLKIENKE